MRVNVPILAVFVAATFVSTMSSMAGGLILYFQGLEALERSVKEVAIADVTALTHDTNAVFDKAKSFIGMDRTHFYSTSVISANESAEWTGIAHRILFSQVANNDLLYYIGVRLFPFDQNITSYYMADVWRWGPGAIYLEEFGPHLPESSREVVDGVLVRAVVDVYKLNATTGDVGSQKTRYDTSSPLKHYMDKDFDPDNGVNNIPYYTGAIPGIDSDIGASVTGPYKFNVEGVIMPYLALTAAFLPPPPPHPWSAYKAVGISASVLLSAIEPIFASYKEGGRDASAMMVDRETQHVLANTAGMPSIANPSACEKNASVHSHDRQCFLNVTDMPLPFRDAFRTMQSVPFGEFAKLGMAGEDYFVVRTKIHSWEILWFRRVASVDEAVQRALGYFIIFTVLVLVFDSLVSVCEVVYVAVPLRRLSRAISAIGHMHTEEAEQAISTYTDSCLMVKEIYSIMHGMRVAVQRLHEFRMFIPHSALADFEESSSSADTSTQSVSSPARSRSEGNSSSNTTACSFSGTGTGKGLRLYLTQKRVGLLALTATGWANCARDVPVTILSYSDIMSAVMCCIQASHGTLESFSGDQFLCGWNTYKPSVNREVNAVISAVKIRSHQAMGKYRVSCGVACGAAHVGNLGNEVIRRFSIVSPAVRWAIEMSSFNLYRGGAAKCTVDASLFGALEGHFAFQVTDALWNPATGQAMTVAEVLGSVEAASQEWMYELQESDTTPLNEVNRFALAVLSQDWGRVATVPKLPPQLAHLEAAYHARCYCHVELAFTRAQRKQDDQTPAA